MLKNIFLAGCVSLYNNNDILRNNRSEFMLYICNRKYYESKAS